MTRERIEVIVREVAEGLPNTPAWMAVIERIAWRRILHEMEMHTYEGCACCGEGER